MLTTDRQRLTVYLEPSIDEAIRVLAARHRCQISEIANAALAHCLKSPHFLAKLKKDPEY